MKIAVIGPGAMGLLYGAKLSKCADVTLIGNNEENISLINKNGVTIKRDGNSQHFEVRAALSGKCEDSFDLIIMFTKAYLTKTALEQNRALIGPDTYLRTLQNGAGHENVLGEFASENKVLLGTTAQGSSRENGYTIVNSGLGDTALGAISPDAGNKQFLDELKEIFEKADFPCKVSDDIRQMVWNKLMINASSSVLSGVLQVRQGYIVENKDAFEMCKSLITEICETTNASGLCFDAAEQINRLENHLKNAPGGLTSIYSDLKNGRKTEVDYINGAVVVTAKKYNVSVPAHEMIVHMVHAMEEREHE
ncbi:MAG: 2-dehydropantoate 2-reductase [Butyrivibrio sp.]|nr:2-dehydropantoate 2-reductase [Butyrivibrio sp.]MBR1640958.1 2-dehydropantoate 2-reductase [Butyrivibrio sp.]